MSTQTPPDVKTMSLRDSLLLLLLVPQLLAWLLGSMVAWKISKNYHEDQLETLLGNQMQVVSRVLQSEEPAAVRLRHAEETLTLMQALEDGAQLHYQISTPSGEILLGNAKLPAPAHPLVTGQEQTYNGMLFGKMRRILAVQVPDGAANAGNPQRVLHITLAKDSKTYYDRAGRLD